jgi:hypothetical protein
MVTFQEFLAEPAGKIHHPMYALRAAGLLDQPTSCLDQH